MRRISLALALMGAVAATGCGGGAKPASTADGKGTYGVNFTVTINNQGPGAISGSMACAANSTCTQTFASGTVVTLNAAPEGTNYFNGWFGECGGTGACTVTGDADRYVVAYFSDKPQSHPNFVDPKLHEPAMANVAKGDATLKCTNCHGETLQGQGLAVACTQCHQQYQVDTFLAVLSSPTPVAVAGQENCATCHAGDGAYHQSIYNKYTNTDLVATIDGVNSTLNTDGTTYTSVVTFTLKKGGVPYTAAQLGALQQKRYTATKLVNGAFETASAITFSSPTATTTPGQFTVKSTAAAFAPESSNSFVYFYFGEKPLIIPAKGHYNLMDNVASIGKTYGTETAAWSSTANVTGCEKCHGTPYMKHGYRAGAVSGLPDMMACKACHTDQRGGVDFNLAMASEDPLEMLRILALPPAPNGEPAWTAEVEETYAYTATTMMDTHISHAKEFLYPQAMANCVTCHEGKLDRILTDANFTGKTCKSCHLYEAKAADFTAKRAPKLEIAYHDIDWVKGVLLETDSGTGAVTEMQCNECHYAGNSMPWGGVAPTFAEVHSGYDARVYDTGGAKYVASIKASLDSASYDATTHKVTATFSVSNVGTNVIKPTLVASLYGFGTKDFIVSGHGSRPSGTADAGTSLLEWTEGACQRGTGGTTGIPCKPANSPRLTVSPETSSAGNAQWTVVADLSLWAAKIDTEKSVSRIEIGFLPTMDDKAVGGVTATIDVSQTSANAVIPNANVYGKNIVDAAKCNKCHEALAIEFHSPNYGSAGVVGCRLCHVAPTGGSHLEMQSRSIDSYVHAIHSFQAMDIAGTTAAPLDYANPLTQFKYDHHVESTYPNFTTLNCESCHNPGTYEVAANDKSLPSVLSGSTNTIKGWTRNIVNVPSVVTGPSSKACGGCHRAEMIKEDDAAKLGWFDAHTGTWGYRQTAGTGTTVYDGIVTKLKDLGWLK